MPGPLELGLILVVVILIFGTKKLRNMGSDLGSAIKNFKSAVKDGGADNSSKDNIEEKNNSTAEAGDKAKAKAKDKDNA